MWLSYPRCLRCTAPSVNSRDSIFYLPPIDTVKLGHAVAKPASRTADLILIGQIVSIEAIEVKTSACDFLKTDTTTEPPVWLISTLSTIAHIRIMK